MQITHRIEGAEFSGDTGSVTGTAVYLVTIEYGLNSDIGGRDGWEALNTELLRVEIDALHLTRDQIVLVTCEAAVRRSEESVVEDVDANVDEYVEAA